jgi:hypothetical protein
MAREFKAALVAVVYLGVLLLAAFILLRFIVPSILEAQFTGSLFAAAVAGFVGVIGLLYLGALMVGRVARLLRDDQADGRN